MQLVVLLGGLVLLRDPRLGRIVLGAGAMDGFR